MQFNVSYTFGATIVVDAENENEARDIVDGMDTDELVAACKDGFEIQSITPANEE